MTGQNFEMTGQPIIRHEKGWKNCPHCPLYLFLYTLSFIPHIVLYRVEKLSFIPLQYVDFMSNNWFILSSYVYTYCVHCCWCWRRHIVLIVELENVKQILHPSFAVLCEWSFAAGLDLFTWITNLCRSCFSTFCIPVGPAFTVSEFDRVDGLGFAFDVFCVTQLFLASQSLLLLNCWHCQELLYYIFLTEDGLRLIRNVSE